jgi:hypothetical protein
MRQADVDEGTKPGTSTADSADQEDNGGHGHHGHSH